MRPAPAPAFLPFSLISAFASCNSWRARVRTPSPTRPASARASSSSCFTSVFVSSASWRTRSVVDSLRSCACRVSLVTGLDIELAPLCHRWWRRRQRGLRGRSARPGGVARAGRLDEAGDEEADRGPAQHGGPRPPPRQLLGVAQKPVAVRLCEVPAQPLDGLGRPLGVLRDFGLALLAQLIADSPERICGRRDLLA